MSNIFMYDGGGLKPWVTWTVVGLVVVVGGYFGYAAWQAEEGPQNVSMICAECGYVRERPLGLGETLPAPCPECGKKSMYRGFKCPKCGEANMWNPDRGLPEPTKCSKCSEEVWHGGG